MSDSRTLPGARAPLVNPDGTTRREFYDFFRRLEQGTTEPVEPVAPTQPGITGAISPLGLVGENVTLQQIAQGEGGELVGVTVDSFGRVSATRPVVAGDGITIDGTTDPAEIAISTDRMANPMTTLGDLIRADTGGAPERLPVGTNGQILTVVSGEPSWATAAGLTNPMTTAGDIITGGASGVPQRLGIGTAGQVLKVVAGSPAWADESGGSDVSSWEMLLTVPPNSTSPGGFGAAAPSPQGGTAARTITNASLITSRPRMAYTATSSTTAISGLRGASGTFLLVRQSGGVGGFRFEIVVSLEDGATVSSHRRFAGLWSNNGAPTDVNPSTLTDIIGLGYDSADTQVQIMHNDGSGAATKVALGASFPKPTTSSQTAYRLVLESTTVGQVNYSVEELVGGATASGTLSTNLPTVALNWHSWASAGGTATAIGMIWFFTKARIPA